jgi:hypothetical protein
MREGRYLIKLIGAMRSAIEAEIARRFATERVSSSLQQNLQDRLT